MDKLFLPVLGLIAGFGSAFLGIGGGVVMVPLLVVAFKYGIKKAIGTSLTAIIPAALVGTATYSVISPSRIAWLPAGLISIGAVAGARAGVVVVKRIDTSLLKVLFAVLLLFVGIKQAGLLSTGGAFLIPPVENSPLNLIVLGLFAGFSSALFGVGGGIVMVPALNLLFGYPMHAAIPTSLCVIIPTTLAGAFFHSREGHLHWKAVPFLASGAFLGAITGALLSSRTGASSLKFFFGIVMLVFSLKIMVNAYLERKS